MITEYFFSITPSASLQLWSHWSNHLWRPVTTSDDYPLFLSIQYSNHPHFPPTHSLPVVTLSAIGEEKTACPCRYENQATRIWSYVKPQVRLKAVQKWTSCLIRSKFRKWEIVVIMVWFLSLYMFTISVVNAWIQTGLHNYAAFYNWSFDRTGEIQYEIFYI